MPSLVQLEYIVAVADQKHFGKAAESCHISQPTLSQQIRKVEESLGIMIFDRCKKPVLVTQEGEEFLRQSRLILKEHRRLKEIAAQKSEQLAGEFRLGVIPTLANTVIPHFLHHFSKTYPKVFLNIDELKTSAILKAFDEGHLDAALMVTPLGQTHLLEEPLFYEPFYIYAAKGHRLLKEKFCRARDLDATDLWVLQDGHCFKDQIAQICSLPTGATASAKMPNVNFQGGSLDTLLKLVGKGHGYTFLPAFMIHQMPPSEVKAHVRAFVNPTPGREVSLVGLRTHWNRKITAAIKDSILKNLPAELHKKKSSAVEVLQLC